MLNLLVERGLYKKFICVFLIDIYMEVIGIVEYDVVLCVGVIVYG